MRYKKSVQPNELKTVYSPNTYFTIKLPRAKLDLHSFTLYYDGLPANYGTTPTRTVRRFFPRITSCIIDEFIVKINSQVKQYTREYNMIHAILHDIYKDDDELQGTSFDTTQEHKFNADFVSEQNLKIQSVAGNLGKYHDAFKESFCISEWLGFLQEGNSRYFDATNTDIEITIKTAPANILYRGIQTVNNSVVNNIFAPDYQLSNIHATIDILDEIPDMPSEYEFLDYHYTQGIFSDNNKNSTTSFQISKPVKWVLGTFASEERLVDYCLQLQHVNDQVQFFGPQILDDIGLLPATITQAQYTALVPNELLYSYDTAKLQKKPYSLNSSIYFSKNGLGISQGYCQFKMNTYDLTPPMSVLSCYNETKKCFDSKYKRVISLQAFESEFFVNAIRIDANDYELKNIEWHVHSAINKELGGMPMLFCCFVNKI
jgi:hypothetical protein